MPRTDTDKPLAAFTLDSDESFELDEYSVTGRVVRGKIRYIIRRLPEVRRVAGEKAIDEPCRFGTM